MKLIHGGDIYTRRNMPENKKLIDFSANINPLGLPLAVKRAIIDNIADFSSYPDPLCRALIDEISKHENIPAEYIVCGNGAADIIYRIAAALKPKIALLTAPTFSEYEEAVKTVNSSIRYHYLFENNEFNVDEDIVEKLEPDIDVVFLCNPNNPTGVPIEKQLLLKIAARCKLNKIVLVVDECFIEFLENSQKYSIVDKLDAFDNVLVLKAFTKIYAMAGIRLGYGICLNKDTVDRIYNAGQPWNVSVVAQKCGIAALKETEYVSQTRMIIKQNREYLMEELRLLGLKVFESKANYILFKTQNKLLNHELEKYGILIRSCDNYTGLNNTYFRIAVRSKEDNQYLIKSMKKIFER
ncbi:MAG: pyridoxal phosphate-dependent aminotransferase [Ruminiclostridium sp.]